MESSVESFLSGNSFAVAGSFRSEEKYAYRIFRMFKDNGKEVVPVNPQVKEVDGRKCYRSVSELERIPDGISLVTPPAVTERMVRECRDLGVKRVWMQPGAENKNSIRFCRDNGIAVIHGLCLIVKNSR